MKKRIEKKLKVIKTNKQEIEKKLKMMQEIRRLSKEHLDLLKLSRDNDEVDLELMKALCDTPSLGVYSHHYDGDFYSYSEVHPIIEALKIWQTKKGMLVGKRKPI